MEQVYLVFSLEIFSLMNMQDDTLKLFTELLVGFHVKWPLLGRI
jgi:hypothetical protein